MKTLVDLCKPRQIVFDAAHRDTVHDILDLKNKKIKPIKKNEKKIVELNSPTSNASLKSSKFSEIVSKIQKSNNLKSYPDINNIPD